MTRDNVVKIQPITDSQKTVFLLIRELTGQSNVLTIPRAFVEYTGTLDAALLLSQILYWSDKGRNGWFYKTYAEWTDELVLSKYQVNKAVNILKNKGILETKIKRANGSPTLHYKLDIGLFTDSFIRFLSQPVRIYPTGHHSEPVVGSHGLTGEQVEATHTLAALRGDGQ